MMSNKAPVEPIVLGKMGSCYGIRGWLRVFSSTEDADSIFNYQPWFIQKAGKWEEVELESWRHHNQDIIIKLKGIDDRDAANALTNCEIIVIRRSCRSWKRATTTGKTLWVARWSPLKVIARESHRHDGNRVK